MTNKQKVCYDLDKEGTAISSERSRTVKPIRVNHPALWLWVLRNDGVWVSMWIDWPIMLSFSSCLFDERPVYNELVVHIRWPKYWHFSFSISPSNEYSGLISFKIDWFDLLTVQGTLRILLQHHSSKVLILCPSAFFTVQLSKLYVTTEKTIALTIQTFVSRVMSLLFNTLSRFVITFLPRSNRFLISWLQSPPVVTTYSLAVSRDSIAWMCHNVFNQSMLRHS